MDNSTTYDVVIVGGGLAGLSSAILLARSNYKVLVLEKEDYPRHKVCGEYISMESKPLLLSLGLPVDELNLPEIHKLQVTAIDGYTVSAELPLGGFGISRFMLDNALAVLAAAAGVMLLTKTKAENIQYADDRFTVKTKDKEYAAKVVCGTWGKRSNIDVKWQRSFLKEKRNKLSNHIAVKYHIRYPWPTDVVGLHNFTDGYCGMSQVEDDRCCLCYLTTAANLQKSGHLKQMEQDVLMKNPVLHKVFSTAEFLYDEPLTISQVSFEQKEKVLDHVLLLGDAAGMITPLCGNGMSMAFHAAKMASGIIDRFLQGNLNRNEMETEYTTAWNDQFARRTSLGRFVQNNFGKNFTTSLFLRTVNTLPFLKKSLIQGTHGKPF